MGRKSLYYFIVDVKGFVALRFPPVFELTEQLSTIDLDQVTLIAKADDPEMESYSNLPKTDYSGKRRKMLVLDPTMLRSLKLWLPGKVK